MEYLGSSLDTDTVVIVSVARWLLEVEPTLPVGQVLDVVVAGATVDVCDGEADSTPEVCEADDKDGDEDASSGDELEKVSVWLTCGRLHVPFFW